MNVSAEPEPEGLPMWAVFESPNTKHGYLAIEYVVVSGEEPIATGQTMFGPLGLMRAYLRGQGLACFPRDDGDRPEVVETWL